MPEQQKKDFFESKVQIGSQDQLSDFASHNHPTFFLEEKHFESLSSSEISQALRDIKKFSSDEKKLSPKERHEIVRARLEVIKNLVDQQRRGIAETIHDLCRYVEDTPKFEVANLRKLIKEKAVIFNFTIEQTKAFEDAINDFEKKHNTVESFRMKFLNDADLFEACFGVKPLGKVVFTARPMSLYVQCFDPLDYARGIFSQPSKNANSFYQPTSEEISFAKGSEGMSVSETRLPELTDILIFENSSKFLSNETVSLVEKTEITDEKISIPFDLQSEDVKFETKNGGKWKIKISERDDKNFPSRLQLVNSEDENNPLFDVRRAFNRHEGRFFLEDATLPTSPNNELDRTSAVLEYDGKVVANLEIDGENVSVENFSSEGIQVVYSVAETTKVFNEKASKKILHHEEQHQINKLFSTVETRRGLAEAYVDSVQRASSLKEFYDFYAHAAAQETRAAEIDTGVRDEIIAFYSDGSSVDEIFKTLTTNRLYQYATPNLIAKSVSLIESNLENMNKNSQELSEKFGEVSDLSYLKSKLVQEIENIFLQGYRDDLKNWIDSVKKLETKGLSREKIVPLLMQEPVRNWQNISR
jgi:hypothetical protein